MRKEKAGNLEAIGLPSKIVEAGFFPKSWRVVTIGRLLEERAISEHLDGNHGEYYPKSHEFKQQGVPYVGANDFFQGKWRQIRSVLNAAPLASDRWAECAGSGRTGGVETNHREALG